MILSKEQQLEQRLASLRAALAECAGKINERDRELALRQRIRELETDLDDLRKSPTDRPCINKF